MKIGAELLFAVGHNQGDLGELGSLARIRTLENNILHFSTAEGLGTLLA